MSEPALLELLALSPTHWAQGTVLLAFLVSTAALLRIALTLEALLSRVVDALLCALAVLPAVALAAVLVFAASRYPERAWKNLALAALVYAAWYGGSALARLARPDADSDDARWIALGACITFPAGVLAALAFG